MHILVGKLQFQLQYELVNDARDDFGRQITEWHRRIEAIAEFRRKHLLHGLIASIFFADIVAKTDAFFRHIAGARVGCHDQNDITEVDSLAVMVGQAAIVHDLQQDVEQVRMRLFDFVE